MQCEDAGGGLVVGAATDGVSLSVQIDDDASRRAGSPAVGLSLVACLPQRLEWAADERGTHLLMEFSMAADERTRAAAVG